MYAGQLNIVTIKTFMSFPLMLKKVTFDDNEDKSLSPEVMLRFDPDNGILFKIDNDEISGQFTMINKNKSATRFQIQTTSPQKFRVRPCCGILATGASQTVMIVVQPGFDLDNIRRDLFQVISMQIPNADSSQLQNQVSQESSSNKLEKYRLKCTFPVTLNDLQINTEKLCVEMEGIKILQMFTLLLTAVSLMLIAKLYCTQQINPI